MSLYRGSALSHISASLRLRVSSANLQAVRSQRHFLKFARKFKLATPERTVLGEDDLFHPFSESPFPAVKARGEAIRSLAPCPICSSAHGSHMHNDVGKKPSAVKFECPDCGWPTHCSREHWEMDRDHAKFCSRLREVNEDEHDLRSGRRIHEFELPGEYGPRASSMESDNSTMKGLKRTRKPSRLPTGISFGIPVVSLRWTPNGQEGMLASCSPTRSP